MEPPQLPIPRGPASKFEKSMFFEPASLNIIQNFIFKLWIEQDDSWADFDIHKWSLFWSPWSPTAKNTLKIWVKLNLNIFQSIYNCNSGAPFWAPIFTYLKNSDCQLSLEKRINVIAILEHFLSSREFTYCENLIFWSSGTPFSGPKIKVPYHFFENFC